jgi:6-phosphofructo-2-kinase
VLENPDLPEFKLWTSSLCRTCETAQPLIDYYKDNKHTGKIKKVSRVRMLNEIYAGYCEGMTYNEIETQYPDVRLLLYFSA